MRADLLTFLETQRELTNVIILTHNVSLVFLEAFVIPRLNKAGHPSVTVFADASCCYEAYGREARYVEGIGRRYRVVPVLMEQGFRFHPKAIMLSSHAQGTLLVGSGNLGFGGWRENGEVWARFDSSEDGGGAIAAFREYLGRVLSRVPLSEPIESEVQETFDTSTHPWCNALGTPSHLIGKCGEGRSLFESMAEIVGPVGIEELTVCSPYFDDQGNMLRQLALAPNANRVRVLVQKGKSGLAKRVANSLDNRFVLQTVDYRSDESPSKFLHAKFYAFRRGEAVTVFVGSANCSNAALSVPGRRGNAELMAVQTMSQGQFTAAFVDELMLLDEDPLLEDLVREENPLAEHVHIRVVAARYEAGNLHIIFESSEGTQIVRCLADATEVGFVLEADNHVVAGIAAVPRTVTLEGTHDGIVTRSSSSWVDSEPDLRASSFRRALADQIALRVTPEEWGIAAWSDILAYLYRDLQYTPRKGTQIWRFSRQKASTTPHAHEVQYTASDVFSDQFALPHGSLEDLPRDRRDRILGLQGLLLQRFGAGWRPFEGEADEPDLIEDTSEDAQDATSRRQLSQRLVVQEPHNVSENEKRKAKKLIDKIIAATASDEFLRTRPPESLAIDLTVIFILLKNGLNEEWITYDDFLALSHKLWAKLFFSTGIDIGNADGRMGWIEYRWKTADDPDDFVRQLRDIELSAVLTAWAVSGTSQITSPEKAFFQLACADSIAKLTWLWQIQRPTELGDHVKQILAHTGDLAPDDPEAWSDICAKWKTIVTRGYALKELRAKLSHFELEDFVERMTSDEIEVGEMLWQGERGFCIATERCRRSSHTSVNVLCLQGSEGAMKFRSDYLLPAKALLPLIGFDNLPEDQQEAARTLIGFLNSCSNMLLSSRDQMAVRKTKRK